MSLRLIFIALLILSASAYGESILLLQGERRTFAKASSAWAENGNLIRIEESSQGFVVKALKPGTSEVRFGSKTYNITVLTLEQERTRKILQVAIQKTLNLRVSVEEGQVVILGLLPRWQDWQTLADACKEKSCQYHMRARISDPVMNEAAQKINQTLSNNSLPNYKIEKNEDLTVQVPIKSNYMKEIEQVLAPYGIQVEKNPNSIELAPLIKVQITIAEVKKDSLLQYGIKWPATYQAQVLPAGTDSQPITAQFLEKTGAGRILASPNIICRSGKEAEFFAGGEFPIKIVNYRVQDIMWKKYGIVLHVKPLADYGGRMSISVETEVSSIDSSRTVDGIPGLFVNRVQSHFDLTEPRTIALSGLIKSEEGKAIDGFPLLSRIPILGSLFSSQEFRDNKSELFIFVRPEIINPTSLPDQVPKQHLKHMYEPEAL